MNDNEKAEEEASSAVPGASSGSGSSRSDARYCACNEDELQSLQQEKPWMKSPQYFESVALSPSAVMKMMMHRASGVEKGIKAGGNSIEVMGLLLGRCICE
jgi:COP9 signalosome complex subunit 5